MLSVLISLTFYGLYQHPPEETTMLWKVPIPQMRRPQFAPESLFGSARRVGSQRASLSRAHEHRSLPRRAVTDLREAARMAGAAQSGGGIRLNVNTVCVALSKRSSEENIARAL